ncbi:RsmB/NOP family class I SAM-dependent RNA methyltransferase [Roseibacterium sp. SDUM158017]|uniref:RsmB/NOP family class I SAM-dependent RNA methyltransferase n=1 Tax=Roseicyclus salinarum TaxID=3036773 RepID=UPI0024154689|nr:RsmB/NOP family class I SAM-dependent RNA methyltransferase [Roseibacterium sp. SDUM158017]MDG4650548.1 RsmB/NOP family class I SAM-dependent RNA methyltransferase [Roseibacterium sp. SDUM158017]
MPARRKRHGPSPARPGGRSLSRTGLPFADRSLVPRHAALRALDHVLRQKRMLGHLSDDTGLDPAEAARATRLADTVLRHLEPLDTVIAQFAERKPPLPVLSILRLGAAELLIAGEEPHGVVNAAVTLTKSAGQRTARASGMVNAVLRRIAEAGPELWSDHAPQRLPGWIAAPVRKAYGEDALRAIEAAHEAGAPLDLTPRDGDVEVPGAERLPTGSLRLNAPVQVSSLPGFAEGAWWVQDAAAALPVRLLGDVRGRRVLDLCAAPGGKTLQLAAAGAEVTAVDSSDARLDRLRSNLARTGLSAKIVVADALEHRGEHDDILLDAPCTATGTLRRHPDLPFVKTGKDTEPLTKLQMHLLDHAIGLLRPGGRLIFCTCSLLPVEGEYQVKAALKRHPGLRVEAADPVALGGEAEWASPEGGLRLRPDFWAGRGGIDGFYMACLTRD